MEWRPIKSAPKDGTPVLLKCPGDRLAVAHYCFEPFTGEGWFVNVPCMGGYGHGTDTRIHWPEDQPTHWAELPKEKS